MSMKNVEEIIGLTQHKSLYSRLKPYVVIAAILLITALTLTVMRFQSVDGRVVYATEKVSYGSLTTTVSATGSFQPINLVDVGSEISGTLKTVEVSYNDRVKRGQQLASLDTTRQEAQVKKAVASLAAAKSRLVQSQVTLHETRSKLNRLLQVQLESGGNTPSQLEIDAATAAMNRAIADENNGKASVSETEALLEAQQIDLAKSVIQSPINGIVLVRKAEPGQTVAASFQTPVLFTLAEDLTQLELQVDVDEADVGKVQPFQVATFTVAAYPDLSFPARVREVRFGSKTVAGVVTYTTVLEVSNEDLLLRPGMTGTARIHVQEVHDAILVPNTALRFEPEIEPSQQQQRKEGSIVSKLLPAPPGQNSSKPDDAQDKQPHVWVMKNGQLQRIAVLTGVTDGVKTEVKSGLSQDMSVVVDRIKEKK